MRVPILDLEAQHAPLRDAFRAALDGVLVSNQFVLGPEVEQLESAVAAYSGCAHAVGVSSGTDALLIALMALDVGPGDEVIVPTFSFFATAGTVSRVGATPVFVDIDATTFNIDPKAVSAAITERTRAIIPVHLYGQIADMAALRILADRHGLAIIEDAAQAIGAEDADGTRAGSFGEIGCLSFYPTKNLGAAGDAGMVVTNRDDLATRLRKLRIHGSGATYYHDMIGGNFRMDAFQAAILNVKLPHLDDWIARRQIHAASYTQAFTEAGLTDGRVQPPPAIYAASGRAHFHIYHQYTIRAERRDELRAFLAEREISSGVYYPLPFHQQTCFADLGYLAGQFPVAEQTCADCLSLPMYPELTEEQIAWVTDSIAAFYAQ